MNAASLMEDAACNAIQDGRHLIFQLNQSSYGIPILEVGEIIGLMEITPIPKAPEFLKGVINLRGKVIPVVDLRLKFGMSEKEYDEQTCIIIVNLLLGEKKESMGLIVDIVSEVFNIPLSEIEESPKYSEQLEEGFLTGIGKVKEKLVMLLNIEKVMHTEEIIKILNDREKVINKSEKIEKEV